jgi:hypothetical protein
MCLLSANVSKTATNAARRVNIFHAVNKEENEPTQFGVLFLRTSSEEKEEEEEGVLLVSQNSDHIGRNLVSW